MRSGRARWRRCNGLHFNINVEFSVVSKLRYMELRQSGFDLSLSEPLLFWLLGHRSRLTGLLGDGLRDERNRRERISVLGRERRQVQKDRFQGQFFARFLRRLNARCGSRGSAAVTDRRQRHRIRGFDFFFAFRPFRFFEFERMREKRRRLDWKMRNALQKL